MNYINFTFSGITTVINKQGEEKKQLIGLPTWKNITKDNYKKYSCSEHHGHAIICGSISNITVLDFDNVESYNKILLDYPKFRKYKTIKTNKGYHIYCIYNKNIMTTTNGLKSYKNVDVRNDNSIIISPPTIYTKKDGSIVKYEDLGGEVKRIPSFIINDLKQNIHTSETESEDSIVIVDNYTYEGDGLKIKLGLDYNLFDHQSKTYTGWISMMFGIRNVLGDNGYYLFDRFCKINKDKYDEQGSKKIYETERETNIKPISMGSINKWMKDSDEFKYKEICSIVKQKKNISDDMIMTNDDMSAANIIYNKIKENIIMCGNRMFIKENNIWNDNTCNIESSLKYIILKSGIYIQNKNGNIVNDAGNVVCANHIYECLMIQIEKEHTKIESSLFHTTTKNRLCFLDGVLDFETKQFYEWDNIKFEYYSTVQIKRKYQDYFKNPDLTVIEEIKKKIYNNLFGEDVGKALQFLSRGITGNTQDKKWASYMGNRDCGKGVCYDNLKYGFEDYVKTFELGNITYSGKTSGLENIDCSKKLYWLMDLEFTRIAISQETPDPSTGLLLSGKMFKKITGGGDTIVARRNYDRYDTSFNIDSTFMIMGNHSLQSDAIDCVEHCLDFQSVKQFKSFDDYNTIINNTTDPLEVSRYAIMDPLIKDKCKSIDWCNAIVYLLFQNWSDKAVRVEIKETVEITSIIDTIKEYYTLTNINSDIVCCADLYTTCNLIDKKKVEKELNSRNIMKRKCATKQYNNKWCYYGLKIKQF